MADAKKCDFCGAFYETPYGLMGKIGYQLVFVSTLMPYKSYDLCPQCDEKLNKFVESMKEENKKND